MGRTLLLPEIPFANRVDFCKQQWAGRATLVLALWNTRELFATIARAPAIRQGIANL